MPAWKSIAREPLVHFVAIGLALFAIDRARSPCEPVPSPAPAPTAAPVELAPQKPSDKRIVIDAAARAQVAERAQRRLGRAPSEPELAAELERWIDEEVLYREALARGLERDDSMIHERIASKMSYVLEQGLILPEPSDAELRALYDAHRDRWSVSERIDFTHVFVAGADAAAEKRIGELAAKLAAGESPERLGDTFSGGRRYRGRKPGDLAEAFGDEFAHGLASLPHGTWQRRRSRHGLHLVRVDRVESGRAIDFAAARLDVRKAWLDERRARALTEAMKQLRAGWDIERP